MRKIWLTTLTTRENIFNSGDVSSFGISVRKISKAAYLIYWTKNGNYRKHDSDQGGAHPMLQPQWFQASGGLQDCSYLFYNFCPLHNKSVNQIWVFMPFSLRFKKTKHLLCEKTLVVRSRSIWNDILEKQ